MAQSIKQILDFERVNSLLEDFNKSTGFVTAILDLEGNVLSKSGWRDVCTQFHRKNPLTAKNCLTSDTVLANKMSEGKQYHFYKCLNGLVDVATPIIIDGEHIANLFTGQFFFETPDISFFNKQALKYGFDEAKYLASLKKVPVISKEVAIANLNFLSSMAHMIGELGSQKSKLAALNSRLKLSESLFKSVFENSNVGKSITSNDGKLKVNQEFADMLGYSVEELQQMRWQDITPKDEIESIQKLIAPLMSGEQNSVRFEKRYFRKDKQIIWADISTVLQRDEKGNASHFITTIVDITTKKNAEHLLKLSEEKFSKAFNIGPNGMAITRISDGRFLDVNESFCSMFGFTKAEVIGHTSTELNMWTPENRQKIVDAQIQQGGLIQTELTALSKSGQPKHVIFSSKPIDIDKERYLITIMIDVTEKKRVELEFKNQSDIFKALVEQSITGIYIFEKDRFRYVNRRFADIFGYTMDEVVKHLKPTDVLKPHERENATQNIDKRLSGIVNSVHYIAEGLHKGGKELWVEIHGTHITIDGHDVITGTVLDITERYLSNRKLVDSERKFRALFEQASVGVGIIDTATGKYLSVNEKQCEIVGYTREEIMQLDFMSISHAEDLAVDLHHMEKLKSGKIDQFRIEKRYIHKKGHIVCVVLNVYPLWNANDSPKQHVAICEEITEQKKAVKQIKESEERYRSLFENMNAGFVLFELVTDKNGKPDDLLIVAANKGFEQTTRLNLKVAQGQRLKKVLPGIEKDEANWIGNYGKVVLTGIPKQFENYSQLLDTYYSVSAFKAGPTLCAVTFTDITDRKKAEIEIKLLNSELEQRVI